jgi:hypothetical protein
MGDFAKKAKDFAADNPDKVDDAVEKAGDFADERTDSKYSEHVDTAQEKAKDYLGDQDNQ